MLGLLFGNFAADTSSMYTDFFQLKQSPFSIAPDPRYLYMSDRHREALAHLLYGVSSGGGFVLLTGEIGAGKTTVCRCFLEQIPQNCNVAYIFNPKLTVEDLLKSICEEFGISIAQAETGTASSIKDYIDALNAFLLAAHGEGRNNVLVIDEAQNLNSDVLEQLRLLTNLETNERKLLQIILIGQPELRDMLAKPELQQLAQRVIARYHLASLSLLDTTRYVLHRLSVAGMNGKSPFGPKLMRAIHRLTHGVPRRINLLCDRALLGAYAEGRQTVDQNILQKAAREAFDNYAHSTGARTLAWRYSFSALALATVLLGAGWTTVGSPELQLRELGTRLMQAAGVVGRSATDQHGAKDQNLHLAAAQGKAVPSFGQQAVGQHNMHAFSDLASVFNDAPDQAPAVYQELARFWDARLQEGQGCEAALAHGLHCYHGSGGLAEIRMLDRPVILNLRDEAGTSRQAILFALTKTEAWLLAGQTRIKLGLLELGRHFHGDFITFWRAPENYRTVLAGGERGTEVDWLASQLAKLSGRTQPEPNQVFDQTLAEQLRKFQRTHGLLADGIAGPKTFMHLNSALGIAEPRLANAAELASASVEN